MNVNNLTPAQKTTIALKLKDTASFFRTYFDYLPHFQTKKDTFYFLNQVHEDIYGASKYSSYESFKNCLSRDAKNYLKTKRK